MKSHESVGTRNGPGYEGPLCCCGFFFMLWIIPLLFIFVYGMLPKMVCVVVLIMLFAGLTPMTFHAGKGLKSSESSGANLSMSMTISFMIATASGLHAYYAHVQPMMALESMRTYTNVYPQQPGLVFNDAAYLQFASTATVDVSRSSSFKSLSSGSYTFCVAPIVDSQNAGRVEFWAVGVDCCGAAGDFQCDSVGESGTQKGWVMRDVGENDFLYSRLGKFLAPPETRRDLFLQATRKAEGLHDITTGEEPVLVRWTNKSKDELIEKQFLSIAAVMGFNLVYNGLVAIVLTALYQRFNSFYKTHDRLANVSVKPHQPSIITANILDFFQHTVVMDRVALQPINFVDVSLMSMVLPCTVLLTSLFFWSFAYCSRFGNLIMAPFIALLFVVISVLLMTPHRCVQGTGVLLVALVGTFIGCYNWDNNVFHYCSVESHRSYLNVFPEADALEFQDAGKLHFQESASLAKTWSVGFKHDDVTYCVAPITSISSCSKQNKSSDGKADDALEEASGDAAEAATSLVEFQAKRSRKQSSFMAKKVHTPLALLEDTSSIGPSVAGRGSGSGISPSCDSSSLVPSRIDFWAVGKNCCNPSGDFWCSNVQDTAARSGVVVYAFQGYEQDNENPWKQYQRAVLKASDSFDLPLPDHPILVKWGNDVDEITDEWLSKAIGILLLTSIVGLLAILAFAMISFFVAKRQRSEKRKLLQRQLEANRGKAKAKAMKDEDASSEGDPTKRRCCSFWQVIFVMITGFGCFCMVFSGLDMHIFFFIDAWLLLLSGVYCVVFVGGDPCLQDALRDRVNLLHKENERLSANNDEMKGKLRNLAKVGQEAERLQAKMAGQAESAEFLLSEISKLQTSKTISKSLNHFFTADRSGDARIDRNEAVRFVSGFTLLKNLVPNFDYSRLTKQVAKHGLTLAEFSVLLSTIVADDPAACRQNLERLCNRTGVRTRGIRGGVKLDDESDDEMPESSAATPEKDFKPFVIGPIRIYGFEHGMFVIAFVAAVLLCIPNFGEPVSMGCALLCVPLTAYLTFFGELIVIVRALKSEQKEYTKENEQLQASNDQLGSEISRLVRLQDGLEVLESQYEGSIAKVQALRGKVRSQTVQLTVDALAELFDSSDANHDHVIDEQEAKQFYDFLETAYRDVPTFDVNSIKSRLGPRITYEQLPELVELILGPK
mmetsp:Transcript_57562/g.105895  ORF Transcript_57562/g.105895 Transcript_57562/m.105895 type:complete len:1174 (+) Transcript_57562:165-3686(+)